MEATQRIGIKTLQIALDGDWEADSSLFKDYGPTDAGFARKNNSSL